MDILTKHTTANNPVLKIVAGIIFIVLPIIGFILGMQFQALNNQTAKGTVVLPIPTTQIPSQIQPTVDETANWKTYTNNQYSFEFKYPPHFSPRVIDECLNIRTQCTSDFKVVDIKTNDYGNCGFTLNFYRNSQNLNIMEWIKSDMDLAKSKATTPLELNRSFDITKVLLNPVSDTYNETYIFSGDVKWPGDNVFRLVKTPDWIVAFNQGINCGGEDSTIYASALSKEELEIIHKSFKFTQ